jgi:hypothetical protein
MVSRNEQKIRRVNLPVQHHRLGGLKHADAFLLIPTDQGLQHSAGGKYRGDRACAGRWSGIAAKKRPETSNVARTHQACALIDAYQFPCCTRGGGRSVLPPPPRPSRSQVWLTGTHQRCPPGRPTVQAACRKEAENGGVPAPGDARSGRGAIR